MRGKIIFTSLSCALLAFGQMHAQTQSKSVYNYTDAFNPIFYTSNGNAYRSASGKPGHAYWQNGASYTIKVKLDDKSNTVSGSATLHYTNNSPDELSYIWLQLDQNLFNTVGRQSLRVCQFGF